MILHKLRKNSGMSLQFANVKLINWLGYISILIVMDSIYETLSTQFWRKKTTDSSS